MRVGGWGGVGWGGLGWVGGVMDVEDLQDVSWLYDVLISILKRSYGPPLSPVVTRD